MFGQLSAKYSERSKDFERLIAAHAIAASGKLVTHHVVDFAPYLWTMGRTLRTGPEQAPIIFHHAH